MAKRKRRAFSKEYKTEVVELIRKSGKSVGAVARELDLTETAVRRWVEQAETDSGGGPEGALTSAEREELARFAPVEHVDSAAGSRQPPADAEADDAGADDGDSLPGSCGGCSDRSLRTLALPSSRSMGVFSAGPTGRASTPAQNSNLRSRAANARGVVAGPSSCAPGVVSC